MEKEKNALLTTKTHNTPHEMEWAAHRALHNACIDLYLWITQNSPTVRFNGKEHSPFQSTMLCYLAWEYFGDCMFATINGLYMGKRKHTWLVTTEMLIDMCVPDLKYTLPIMHPKTKTLYGTKNEKGNFVYHSQHVAYPPFEKNHPELSNEEFFGVLSLLKEKVDPYAKKLQARLNSIDVNWVRIRGGD